MTFGEPTFLFALLLVPALAVFLRWSEFRQRVLLSRLGDADLIGQLSPDVNRRGRRIRSGLWVLAIALVVIALARPQWGTSVQVVEREGIQIMLALDVSESMLAEDVTPNRLVRAKVEIASLLNRLRGDEAGLVLFSGASFIQFPITYDFSTAETFLRSANPRVISRPGTAIADAIQTALTGFDSEHRGQKAIIVMSDGENHESDPFGAASEAARQGVVVYTVGLGSSAGANIPQYNSEGEIIGLKTDGAGVAVLSRLNEAALQQIARDGNGRYFNASQIDVGSALTRELDLLETASFERELQSRRAERFQWFLAAALIALAASQFMPERKRGKRRSELLETVPLEAS